MNQSEASRPGPIKEPQFGRGHALALEELQAVFPGWQAWYIPSALGGGATWCARRLPVLETGSAAALVEQIAAVLGIKPPLVDTITIDPVGPDRLKILDRLQLELRAAFPDWHITYSPHRGGPVTWRAYRKPILRADHADALARDMRMLERERPPRKVRRPASWPRGEARGGPAGHSRRACRGPSVALHATAVTPR